MFYFLDPPPHPPPLAILFECKAQLSGACFQVRVVDKSGVQLLMNVLELICCDLVPMATCRALGDWTLQIWHKAYLHQFWLFCFMMGDNPNRPASRLGVRCSG